MEAPSRKAAQETGRRCFQELMNLLAEEHQREVETLRAEVQSLRRTLELQAPFTAERRHSRVRAKTSEKLRLPPFADAEKPDVDSDKESAASSPVPHTARHMPRSLSPIPGRRAQTTHPVPPLSQSRRASDASSMMPMRHRLSSDSSGLEALLTDLRRSSLLSGGDHVFRLPTDLRSSSHTEEAAALLAPPSPTSPLSPMNCNSGMLDFQHESAIHGGEGVRPPLSFPRSEPQPQSPGWQLPLILVNQPFEDSPSNTSRLNPLREEQNRSRGDSGDSDPAHLEQKDEAGAWSCDRRGSSASQACAKQVVEEGNAPMVPCPDADDIKGEASLATVDMSPSGLEDCSFKVRRSGPRDRDSPSGHSTPGVWFGEVMEHRFSRFSQSTLYRAKQENFRLALTTKWSKSFHGVATSISLETTRCIYCARLREWLFQVVQHEDFDIFIVCLVFVNAVLVGAQVNHSALSDEQEPFFFMAELACTCVFTVELLMRLFAYGLDFFYGGMAKWHALDSALIMVSWLDIVLTQMFGDSGVGSGAFLGKMAKVIRIARIMKIIRAVRFLAQLRVMAQMILGSMLSLFWIFVILGALIYVFSIVLTEGATDYLKGNGSEPSDAPEVRDAYGSLFHTMYSLFKAMSGGRNWGELSDLMMGPGWIYCAIVLVYVFFTVFSVVNIVTGVFVDNAIELAKRDRQLLLQKRAKDEEANIRHMMDLMHSIDTEERGVIDRKTFETGLLDPEVCKLMEALEIDVTDAETFFTVLDKDGNGEVDLVEFVQGMQKLSGEAKRSDIQIMMHENRALLKVCAEVCQILRAHEKAERRQQVQDVERSQIPRRSTITGLPATEKLSPRTAMVGTLQRMSMTSGSLPLGPLALQSKDQAPRRTET